MPRRCSVYGCRSNYDGETERTTTFALPRDENQRKLWLEHIPTDFSKLKHPFVCLKHFAESDIIRIDRVMVRGEMKEFDRIIPKLVNNAIPTIFPNTILSRSKKHKVKYLAHGKDQQIRTVIETGGYAPLKRTLCKDAVPTVFPWMVEPKETEEVRMKSNATSVIPELYHTEFIKSEIKEEFCDVNEGSSDSKLMVEELSKQSGVVSFTSQCGNNQLFHADNQQTNVKIEIKEEPIWIENTSVETNGDSDAELQNEVEETALLITGAIEDERLQRLNTGAECSNDRSTSSFTLEQEQSSGLEDDNIYDSEDSKESHKYESFEKSSTSIKQNRDNKPHRCEVCDASFKRAFSLKRHKLTHDDNKKYKCDICEKNFKCPWTLRRHTVTHDDKRPFKCDICNTSFKRLLSLKRHILSHNDNTTHKCEHCEKTFKWLSSLKRHYTVYHGEKTYQCGTCEEIFSNEFALKKHILDNKPHKCELCEKSFMWKSQLKKHSVVHEYSRPHICEVCKKTFKRISHLKSHIIIHEEIRPHKCEICEKRFTQTSSLNRHYLSHQLYSG